VIISLHEEKFEGLLSFGVIKTHANFSSQIYRNEDEFRVI
jgi:hypothetical protein